MNKDEKLPIREASDDEIIRFKGLADGCKTWDAVIERLEEMKKSIQRLKNTGYIIKSPVEDDYLFYHYKGDDWREERLILARKRKLEGKDVS